MDGDAVNTGQFFAVVWVVSLGLLFAISVVKQGHDLVWFEGAAKAINVLAATLFFLSTIACVWIASGIDLKVSL